MTAVAYGLADEGVRREAPVLPGPLRPGGGASGAVERWRADARVPLPVVRLVPHRPRQAGADVTAVLIQVQAMAPPRPGLWCDRCALPSVVEFDFVVSSERATVATMTVRECSECGS